LLVGSNVDLLGCPVMRLGEVSDVGRGEQVAWSAYTVDRQVAEGDKVVARWSVDAIQTGPFLGLPATGKSVHVTGINIFRIVDGRIVEGWHNLDVIGMLEQPGIAPSQ
jgi:predicted ester cyclase